MGILGREVAKTTIDTTVAKQAINAIRALDEGARDGAIRTILDKENLLVLLPIFSTIMRMLKLIYGDLGSKTKDFVDNALIGLYDNKSHLLSVELNLSYYIQALGIRRNVRKEEILIDLFAQIMNPLIRRQIILTMAGWGCHYWLSDIKQHYGSFTEWEKRAFILASYVLGDEGKYWRDHTKASWNPMEKIIRDWFSTRYQSNRTIPL